MTDTAPCLNCGRPMRRWGVTLAEAPGTIAPGARGMCSTCDGNNGEGLIQYSSCRRCGVRILAEGSSYCSECAHIQRREPTGLDWMANGACAQIDPGLWYPKRGGHDGHIAKRFCNGDPAAGIPECPVRAQCLQYALDNREGWGVWGGMATWERQRLLEEAA